MGNFLGYLGFLSQVDLATSDLRNTGRNNGLLLGLDDTAGCELCFTETIDQFGILELWD